MEKKTIQVDDEVITKISKAGIPAGTFGIVTKIENEDIWVDVYIPAESDIPEDTIRYIAEELQVQ